MIKHNKLVKIALLSMLLASCSSNGPGDLGRMDTSKVANRSVTNLNYSKIEKKYETHEAFVRHIAYSINLKDHFLIEGIPFNKLPPSPDALYNSFNKAGMFDVELRYQSMSKDLDQRIHKMQTLRPIARELFMEDRQRLQIAGRFPDIEGRRLAQTRHEKNVKKLKHLVIFLEHLQTSYQRVVDYGKLQEPTLSASKIEVAISDFEDQIKLLDQIVDENR